MRHTRLWAAVLLATLTFAATACGNLTPESTDAAIGGDGGSVSAVVPAASASGASEDSETTASDGMGGYVPVSDVAPHSAVVEDVCDINALLDAESIDWDAVGAIYRDGGNAVNSDGSIRTLAGFTTSERDEPIWNDHVEHHGDPVWIDTFVTAAIEGSGPFEGESDSVRKQGTQKGLQNHAMLAWMLHEIVGAQDKVAAGETDPAEGAPHNVDEAWAFYHGNEPDCAPFATATKRGDNYGIGNAVNDAMLEHVEGLQAAAMSGDAEAYQTHFDGVLSQINTTYIQATQRYASEMDASVASGDMDSARVEQVEGWAFYRVIEPMVAAADPAAAELISSVYDPSNAPTAGQADAVREALEAIYADLGVTKEMVGTLG